MGEEKTKSEILDETVKSIIDKLNHLGYEEQNEVLLSVKQMIQSERALKAQLLSEEIQMIEEAVTGLQ